MTDQLEADLPERPTKKEHNVALYYQFYEGDTNARQRVRDQTESLVERHYADVWNLYNLQAIADALEDFAREYDTEAIPELNGVAINRTKSDDPAELSFYLQWRPTLDEAIVEEGWLSEAKFEEAQTRLQDAYAHLCGRVTVELREWFRTTGLTLDDAE